MQCPVVVLPVEQKLSKVAWDSSFVAMENSGRGIRMPAAFVAVSTKEFAAVIPEMTELSLDQKQLAEREAECVDRTEDTCNDTSLDMELSGTELTPVESIDRPQALGDSKLDASTTSFATVASSPLAPQDVDRYGFRKASQRVTRSTYDAWSAKYEIYVSQRRIQWHKLMADSGLATEDPIRFPARSRRTTRYIRKGVPPEWRGAAWWWYSGGQERLAANSGVYENLVSETLDLRNSDTEHIERDLHRTFPDNVHFRPAQVPGSETANGAFELQEGEKVKALRRVLTAFSVYSPKIGYCQSLNFIAANLLLFLDEEKTFWMLVIITQQYLTGLHEVNLEKVNIYQGVLLVHIRDRLPKVWQAFELEPRFQENFVSDLPPISLCSASWFMSLFVSVLPTETAMRVWDCFFYDGLHTLFRIALTIFKLAEPELAAADDEAAVFQCVQRFPQTLVDPQVLLGSCYKHSNGFGHPSETDIRHTLEFVAERRRAVREAEASLPLVQQQARWSGSDHVVSNRRAPLLSVLSIGGHANAIDTTDREEYARFRPRNRIKSRLHLYR